MVRASAQGREILTLQKVGCQKGRRGVCAGQTLLQEVSLELQGKQVSRREFKTPQISTPKAPEHPPPPPRLHLRRAQSPRKQQQPGTSEQTVSKGKVTGALHRQQLSGQGHVQQTPHTGALTRSPSRHNTPLKGTLTNSYYLCYTHKTALNNSVVEEQKYPMKI